ncbi:Titin [Eumeta japonica]|uniref:Titin n=1 Tax=Eumeta variegata TaxID=151549 RepID=A0A4C1TUA0_EUMVA|nr:Titin [Eumeta japonica]
MGSRLRTTNDFGFVTLDINSVVPEDAGVYMCRAYNAAGEAVSSTAMKEASMNRVPEMFVDTTPQQAPVFTTHLQSFDKLSEGQHVLLKLKFPCIRSTFDFGLVTLSINGLRADDSAIYTCKATNQMGEAVSTCSLKIEDRHWLQAESLHPDSATYW